MKKLFIFIPLFVLFVIITSCTSSKEEGIIGKFNNYVATNFDDPKSLKEIVEVKKVDSITYSIFVDVVTSIYQADTLLREIDSLKSIKVEGMFAVLKRDVERYNNYERARIRLIFKDLMELGEKEKEWLIYDYGELQYLKKDLDSSLKKLDNICIYIYEIKTRIKINGELKLKSYYALEDNVRKTIIFFDYEPDIDDYPQDVKDFNEIRKKYVTIQNKYDTITKKMTECIKKLKFYIK